MRISVSLARYLSITESGGNAQREFFAAASRVFSQQRRNGDLDDLQGGTPPPFHRTVDRKTRSTRDHIRDILICKTWRLHGDGRRIMAVASGLRACIARPRTVSAWKSLVALALKQVTR